MNLVKRLVIGLMVAAVSVNAAALDLNQGIHGMPWGANIAEFNQLADVRRADAVTYYANADMIYQVADRPVPAVVYGFYQGRLFAAFIKMQSPDQFNHAKRHFTKQYGAPKRTVSNEAGQTVYRWKDGDVKIKLKRKESVPDFKLAIYYTPLSQRVNEARTEAIPEDTYQRIRKEGSPSSPSLPLLED